MRNLQKGEKTELIKIVLSGYHAVHSKADYVR